MKSPPLWLRRLTNNLNDNDDDDYDDDDNDDNCDYGYNEIDDTMTILYASINTFISGYTLVLLNFVNVISAVSTCYPVNGQQYCFYTDGSTVLNWDEARQFCSSRNYTLPIITDKDIDNVFQRFISDNNLVEVSGSDTQQTNNYVWLDAHARQVDDSDPWHWINGQPSGSCSERGAVVGCLCVCVCSLASLRENGYSRDGGVNKVVSEQIGSSCWMVPTSLGMLLSTRSAHPHNFE